MIKFTSENLLAYVRIALYNLGAFLVTKGVISGGVVEAWSGVILNLLTFGWTLYGQRLIAKINELAKVPNLVIVAPPAIASEAPAANVVSSATTAVISK